MHVTPDIQFNFCKIAVTTIFIELCDIVGKIMYLQIALPSFSTLLSTSMQLYIYKAGLKL